jgi:hypothetical protein
MNGDPSFSWSRQDPVPKREAIAGLRRLKDDCTRTQLNMRHEAFGKAEQFIKAGPIDSAPLIRTFKNRNLPRGHKDARVDIEVLEGVAFV